MNPRKLSITTDPILGLTWRIALLASVGMFSNTLYTAFFYPHDGHQRGLSAQG